MIEEQLADSPQVQATFRELLDIFHLVHQDKQ